MKRLAVFDFDATLVKSPEKEEGKLIWKEKTGQDYPHIGWWGRKESLDTDVFDIETNSSVINQFNQEKNTPDTDVIILTSRMEKLRSEVQNVLDMHNIVADDVILKKGNKGKGDIIMDIVRFNPDLKEINVYDDFMNKNQEKIDEYLKIKNELPKEIMYNLFLVQDGKISLMESTNILYKMIHEELGNVF